MAEDINFFLDQTRANTSFLGLQGTSNESIKSRGTEYQKEELSKTREREEQRSVDKTESLKSKVKIFQEVRQETEVVPKKISERHNQETQQDIAPAERRELQLNRQEISKDARAESRNRRSQGPSGSNEFVRTSEGSARGPQKNSNDDPNIGSDLANQMVMLSTINRIEKFQNDAQPENIKESVKIAREEDIATEQELLADQTREELTINDLEKDASVVKDSENLGKIFVTDEVTRADLKDNSLAENDTKIQEHLNKEKAAEKADAFRDDPKLDITSDIIESEEIEVNSIDEGLNANSLPGPRSLELRDVNFSAIETERGQNISELI